MDPIRRQETLSRNSPGTVPILMLFCISRGFLYVLFPQLQLWHLYFLVSVQFAEYLLSHKPSELHLMFHAETVAIDEIRQHVDDAHQGHVRRLPLHRYQMDRCPRHVCCVCHDRSVTPEPCSTRKNASFVAIIIISVAAKCVSRFRSYVIL